MNNTSVDFEFNGVLQHTVKRLRVTVISGTMWWLGTSVTESTESNLCSSVDASTYLRTYRFSTFTQSTESEYGGRNPEFIKLKYSRTEYGLNSPFNNVQSTVHVKPLLGSIGRWSNITDFTLQSGSNLAAGASIWGFDRMLI